MLSTKSILIFVFTMVSLGNFVMLYIACADVKPSLEPKKDNYITIDYNKLMEGRYWVQLSGSGEIIFIKFDMAGANLLKEVKIDTISEIEYEEIAEELKRMNFYNLNQDDINPTGDIIYEGDILRVFAQTDSNAHLLVCRPPDYIPAGLRKVVQIVEEKISLINSHRQPIRIIKAELISQERADKLKKRGQQFLTLDKEELQEFSTLQKAILSPEKFLIPDASEQEQVEQYFRKKSYSFITVFEKNYQVEIFSFK